MIKKILVGISGGIDSTATVLMLREKGYQVVGLFIDMLDSKASRASVTELARRLSIELHIAQCSSLFDEKVVKRVTTEHREGRTPSPCTICNPLIKFAMLKKYADELGIHSIATGHYINIVTHGGRYYIAKGVDPIKDQSYYLYALREDILPRLLTPLGIYTKKEVREYLAKGNFEEMATMSESQGVCFAKSGYRDFLVKHTAPIEGKVLNTQGEEIGTHSGYTLYTIGQKRGFTLFDESQKAEVRAINPLSNTIIVGEPHLCSEILLTNSWLSPISENNITIKIRGLGQNPTEAVEITKLSDTNYLVKLPTETFWAATPGQPAVLFDGDIVVGGGTLALLDKSNI